MNINVSGVPAAVAEVQKLLERADKDIAAAMKSVAKMQEKGVAAAERVGIPVGLIGQVLVYAGRVSDSLGQAANNMAGLHHELHLALERMEGPQPQGGGGGGKTRAAI